MARILRHEARFSRWGGGSGPEWRLVARIFRHEARFSCWGGGSGPGWRLVVRIFRHEARFPRPTPPNPARARVHRTGSLELWSLGSVCTFVTWMSSFDGARGGARAGWTVGKSWGNGGEARRSNRRKPLEFQRFRVAGRTSPGGCATPGGFRLRQKESAECPVFGHNSSRNAMSPGTQAFPRPSRCSSHLGTKNTPSYVHALPATENVKTLCARTCRKRWKHNVPGRPTRRNPQRGETIRQLFMTWSGAIVTFVKRGRRRI